MLYIRTSSPRFDSSIFSFFPSSNNHLFIFPTPTNKHHSTFFFAYATNQQSKWIPSSRPATTSLTRSTLPLRTLPTRPTSPLPRTATPASATGMSTSPLSYLLENAQANNHTASRVPVTPSRTRPTRRATMPRLRPTSRRLPTKSSFAQ